MSQIKRIAKIEVISAGSNPDIDSDFRTDIRDQAIEHVSDIYGKDNVANIITFGTLAAKSAFKQMCTIYQIPFASANKIAALVPPPIEGVDCTLEDIFNPNSDRYAEGADFRDAVSGHEWAKIIEGAKNIEGRIKSTGVHPCGLIISSKPLSDVIPLQVRQDDGRVITQWTYSECEDMGLIKFDFLGLDTVDLIQYTVEYIMKNGKNPPNMVDIIHGPMDDKKTYELFSRGETIGVFQFGSPLVQDFCKIMKPTEFEDLAATTALCRPGPMGIQSHFHYASRKNGRAEVRPIHPEFKGSPLDEILGKTFGLIVYQEQVQKITNQISGWTLQEGDKIRKAMGKKEKSVMDSLEEKFISGGMKNGYSKTAMKTLWSNIMLFASYGFNRSHSIAYAMNAYQAAYLKTNYPVEFMAALIAQNVTVKEKVLSFLQEARRMKLKVGSVDINRSDVRVAPDYTGTSGYDIVYGLSGVNAVSVDIAKIIVKEREDNGEYKSIQDLINRCSPLGVTNKKIYENLALAGAFDSFDLSRRGAVENLSSMLGEAKTKANLGSSLFDMFDDEYSSSEMDLSDVKEYPFVEKLQKEANVIGLYLTAHPLSRTGVGLSHGRASKISSVLNFPKTTTVNVVGSITEIEKKILKKGGKSIKITIDDGSGYIQANLQRNIVKGIDKFTAQDRFKRLYINGENEVSEDIYNTATNKEFLAIEDIEKNNVYVINLTFRPAFGDSNYGARVNSIKPLELTDDGKLPIRLRVNENKQTNKERIVKFAKILSEKHPGEYPIYAALINANNSSRIEDDRAYYDNLLKTMKEDVKDHKKAKNNDDSDDLFGTNKVKNKENESNKRTLPSLDESIHTKTKLTEQELAENVEYFDTGYTCAKNNTVEEILSNKFGAERIDFGIFNESLLED